MKKTMSKVISAILCTILIFSSVSVLAAETEPVPVVNGIANPVYDSDTETSVYSYVYFGHYPQSEIKGDDLTDEIVNANYNKYGVAIVNNNQYWRVEKDSVNHYYITEPIKWRVLNIDKNYMTLMCDSILTYYYYNNRSNNSWKISELRSWLNGYTPDKNSNTADFSEKFQSFKDVAFTEDEYDICQLNNVKIEDVSTDDYIILPSYSDLKRNDYGFNNDDWYSSTRSLITSDYGNFQNYEVENIWHTIYYDIVDSFGNIYDGDSNAGVVPIVKILTDSDQYYTSKPKLEIGKAINTAEATLKYDSVVYDGTSKTPKVTVTDGGEVLEQDVDYTVKYSDNTKAGTAKVTISGCGNYYGDIEKTFDITRKEQVISRVEDSYKLTYGDKPFRLNALTSGDGAITYQSSDESVIIAAPKTGKITIKGVGTATVTVKAAQTDNYSEAVKEIKMIVKPQKVSGVSQKSASKNSVNISWSKLNGVSGYEIYRYNPDYEEYRLAKTVSGNITNSTITGLSSGKIYKFKIRAFVNGTTKTYGAFSSEFNAVTKPGATIVKKFKYKKGARARIEAKFKKISCTGYQVKFAKKKSFKGAKTYKTTSPKYSIMINSGKRWYVKVRPYITCNGKTYYGSWSGKKSVKTK